MFYSSRRIIKKEQNPMSKKIEKRDITYSYSNNVACITCYNFQFTARYYTTFLKMGYVMEEIYEYLKKIEN